MASAKHKSENEAELKIKLSSEDLEKVFKALSGKSGTSEVLYKFTPRLYYDTQGLDFYQNNISLRVQHKSGKDGKKGGYEQTVKIELQPDSALGKGVMFRKECKNDIKGNKPDLKTITDKAAKRAVKPFLKKKLVPIFTAAIERRYFEWDLKKGKKKGLVEVAFDTGFLILADNTKQQAFSEIEVELKAGSSKFIEIVKEKVLEIAPSAKVQVLSKSDQGSKLYLKHNK